MGDVYLVNGESDAPAGEEQRAPANGWCELVIKLAAYSRGGVCMCEELGGCYV